ncbi:MAG: hypothetical protein HYV27_14495 [Candidatus Hydrogenedentes bacterium]|nr:hypothetical protein [Candidatus Hydrogenedentota bacterium]
MMKRLQVLGTIIMLWSASSFAGTVIFGGTAGDTDQQLAGASGTWAYHADSIGVGVSDFGFVSSDNLTALGTPALEDLGSLTILLTAPVTESPDGAEYYEDYWDINLGPIEIALSNYGGSTPTYAFVKIGNAGAGEVTTPVMGVRAEIVADDLVVSSTPDGANWTSFATFDLDSLPNGVTRTDVCDGDFFFYSTKFPPTYVPAEELCEFSWTSTAFASDVNDPGAACTFDSGEGEGEGEGEDTCFEDNLAALNFDGFADYMATSAFHPEYDAEFSSGDPLTADGDYNGIYDRYEFALLAQAMCGNPAIAASYAANLELYAATWFGCCGPVENGGAAMETISTEGASFVNTWLGTYGNGPYASAKAAGEPLAADGDYDNDGLSNLDEFNAVITAGGDPALFAQAASDPSPFWAGNPALPTVDLTGLAAAALLLGAASYLIMRRATRARN